MKVYLISSQASYDEGFSIEEIHTNEQSANDTCKHLQEKEKSQYIKYYVEEYDVVEKMENKNENYSK